IEDYLAESAAPERTLLLRELVVLEVHYRRLAGEACQVHEYAGARTVMAAVRSAVDRTKSTLDKTAAIIAKASDACGHNREAKRQGGVRILACYRPRAPGSTPSSPSGCTARGRSSNPPANSPPAKLRN